ncbi:endonuclease domain-containing protein [Sphingomonas sp. PB4P5]|uniref:endonuclease domain-containing protein n=1 Tax=Parasphingomonas puruogangriensis TaxID=3096155 RepID=UPI002FCC8CF2
MRRVSRRMTSRARALRREATPAERAIWRLISRYRPAFTRQLTIDERYIIDLANRTAKLAVEFDGSQHLDQADYDADRTTHLEAQGWRVIRLWNTEVLANPQGAAEHILRVTAECLGGTHPQPLPSREGRRRAPRTRPDSPP